MVTLLSYDARLSRAPSEHLLALWRDAVDGVSLRADNYHAERHVSTASHDSSLSQSCL